MLIGSSSPVNSGDEGVTLLLQNAGAETLGAGVRGYRRPLFYLCGFSCWGTWRSRLGGVFLVFPPFSERYHMFFDGVERENSEKDGAAESEGSYRESVLVYLGREFPGEMPEY